MYQGATHGQATLAGFYTIGFQWDNPIFWRLKKIHLTEYLFFEIDGRI